MKRLKIGVFGAGRGIDMAKDFMLLNCDIVALCDFNEKRRKNGLRKLGSDVVEYTDFDSFIEHDMDAVILANYFHEHAEYAVRCLERGIHVYSETLACGTMAKGVALIRAAEKSNAIYMFAENYPQKLTNLEIQKICKSGTLGKIVYAEGEYTHAGDPKDGSSRRSLAYFPHHWRNYDPKTYYSTHALAPLMKATGATPKKVTAFTVHAPVEGPAPVGAMMGDAVAMIMTQNDDGSIFKFSGTARIGGASNCYRVCGTLGQVENPRSAQGSVLLRYNDWSTPEGAEVKKLYDPTWDPSVKDFVKRSGHSGSDYITSKMFVEYIEQNRQPEHPFDVYSAVTMAATAILAHRAVLAGGAVYDIPDFRCEEDRKQYENDHACPFYGSDGSEPTISCSSKPGYKPTDEQFKLYLEAIADC